MCICGKWQENVVKRLTCCDIKMIKLSTAAFVLMIAVLWPPLASLEWYWYLIIAAVAGAVPTRKLFKK